MVIVRMDHNNCGKLVYSGAPKVASNKISIRRNLREEETQFSRTSEEAVGEDGGFSVIKEQSGNAEKSYAQAGSGFSIPGKYLLRAATEIGMVVGSIYKPGATEESSHG